MALADQLQRVITVVDPAATVIRTRRLHGGIATVAHLVSVDIDGDRHEFVLKRYAGDMWANRADVAMEVQRLLAGLRELDIPAPEPVWSDSGETFGVPALITVRMPGRMDFRPALTDDGIDQAARILARIHALEASDFGAALGDGAGAPPSGHDLLARIRPEWGGDPLGDPLVRLLGARKDAPRGSDALVHGDFYPGNLLWQRGRLTAVLDWDAARSGFAEGDVAYYRLHLALTGPDGASESFRRAYESHGGRQLIDLHHWDARAALFAVGRHPFWMRIYEVGRLPTRYDDIRARLRRFIRQCAES